MRLNGAAEPAVEPALLELVATVAVPGAKRFIADDHLRANGSKAKVKIAFVWDAFAASFLPKVEESVPPGELKVYKLTKGSVDAGIISALGETRESTLADLYAMLEKQSDGEEGPLLTNGWANIFYIRAKDGSLWAVYAHWFVGREGWYVNAYSVENPHRQNMWDGGRQIVSR